MSLQRLRILVADDSPTDRLIMEILLKRQGHVVDAVADGLAAVQHFEASPPDLVLLDVMMPEMDGISAARRMRELAGNELIPIIFLTSLNDARDLAACLEAGGDDFLSKPYNPVILQAKIKAFSRVRRLHSEVRSQREHLIAEQQAAKGIFDRIARLGALRTENIRYLMSPMAIFNGDVLLAARQPGGDLLVLLGDFTGHGLPAAIGIMPLSEIFYGMVAKSFGLEAILREINGRLKLVLPPSVFCCATAAQFSYRNRHAEIWAGGLPDGVVYHPGNRSLTHIPSRHLPLGVLAVDQFRYSAQIVDMQPDDALYLWSDGIIETTNPAGDMFGEQRLLALFEEGDVAHADMFARITGNLREFSQQGSQSDDYSLVEVRLRDNGAELQAEPVPGEKRRPVGNWSLEYELRAESLRTMDPVPLLMHMLLQAPGLRAQSGTINTILNELYSNALEHGVLGLDSGLKNSADGFRQYYQLRAERLQQLEQASIRLRAEVLPENGGGVLRLQVKDSGKGFKFESPKTSSENPAYYGRGLTLVAALCRRVEYSAPGNEVLVEFAWRETGQ
ncbi:MAG: ATP-binding SpoIIE family protein phosphatase [Moraxellaceae bacterium]